MIKFWSLINYFNFCIFLFEKWKCISMMSRWREWNHFVIKLRHLADLYKHPQLFYFLKEALSLSLSYCFHLRSDWPFGRRYFLIKVIYSPPLHLYISSYLMMTTAAPVLGLRPMLIGTRSETIFSLFIYTLLMMIPFATLDSSMTKSNHQDLWNLIILLFIFLFYLLRYSLTIIYLDLLDQRKIHSLIWDQMPTPSFTIGNLYLYIYISLYNWWYS